MNKTINNQRYESVIQWLVLARKKKGLTIRQFAELIDEPHQLVNRVEKCQRKLNFYEYFQHVISYRNKTIHSENGVVTIYT